MRGRWSVETGHHHVQDDHVWMLCGRDRDPVSVTPATGGQDPAAADRLQAEGRDLADVAFVIDQQHVHLADRCADAFADRLTLMEVDLSSAAHLTNQHP